LTEERANETSEPLSADSAPLVVTPSLPATFRRPSSPERRVRAEDRPLCAKDRKRTTMNRQLLANDSPRTNGTRKSNFGNSSLLFLNRPLFFLSSSSLVMDRKSTADDSTSFAMNW
jgi:hypothetical protein